MSAPRFLADEDLRVVIVLATRALNSSCSASNRGFLLRAGAAASHPEVGHSHSESGDDVLPLEGFLIT